MIPPVLIVVSSLAAAGPCAVEQLRTEGDLPVPVSHYGRSKLAGEQAAAKYTGIVPITIVRPPIVYGPGDQGMFEMFKPIARWGIHIVPGEVEHRFSLIHVDDLVEGLLLAAYKGERLSKHDSIGKGIYYLTGDECPTYTQIGQAIALALEKKPPRIMHLHSQLAKLVGVIGDVTSRITRYPSWVSRDKINEVLAGSWSCSSAKAQLQLGWYPVITLPDGLRETALWYQHAHWL
jgi:nucleoside-diphosphate-sugar epimerase